MKGGRAALLPVLLGLAACAPPPQTKIAIVGAGLDPGNAQRIEKSVVVIEDGRILAAGPQATTPVPKGSQVIDGYGGEVKPFAMQRLAPGEPADLTLFKGTQVRVMKNGRWAP